MKKILLFLSVSFCLSIVPVIAQNSVSATVGSNVPVLPLVLSVNTAQYDADIQSEVHISINKNHPKFLIVSANTYVDSANVRQQGYYYSNDGGQTWTGADDFPGYSTTANIGGDPSTAIDANGTIYISSMNGGSPDPGNYYLDISHDNGATWTQETANVSTGDFDKEMIAADANASSPYKNNVYCVYTDFQGKHLTGSTISFSKYSGGVFTSPKILFAEDTNGGGNNFGHGSNVQTGPHGEIYACWANYYTGSPFTVAATGLGFCRSYDSGHIFTTPNYPSFIAFTYNGYDDNNGGTANSNFGSGGGTRVNCYPSMAVDKSCLHNGRIYVAYSGLVSSKYVIQVRYSDDSGSAWSSATTVCTTSSDSNSFFPWITVDDVTGIVCVAYYTTNNSSWSTNTYMAYSTNGGSTYNNVLVSDSAHGLGPIDDYNGFSNSIYPSYEGYAGDYIGIAAHNDTAYVGWMDDRNNDRGEWQVYVAHVIIGPYKINTHNTTFSNDSIQTDIEVTPGDTLTIPGGVVLKMGAGHKIIVDTNAVLDVSGTITDYAACGNNNLWAGIQVNGNTTQSQTGTHQGTVILKPGSKIEYAVTGITTNSGIISANGAEFYNDENGVQISNYTSPYPSLGLNKSRFANCIFKVDNNFLSYGYPGIMVNLNNVHGIDFSGNWFQDSIPLSSLPEVGQRSWGIYCWDASCNIGSCASNCFSGCCGLPNTFKGLGAGIISIAPNPSNIVSIIGNSFINNYFDIDIENINNEIITGNSFTKNASVGTANTGTYPYNIYLDGCSGYHVSGNILSNTYYSSESNPSYGIVVNNSGSANNLINSNTFNGIYVQSQAQGTNGAVELGWINPHLEYLVYSGLQFQCNQYTSAVADGADISVASGIIDFNQGSCVNGHTTTNNEFTYTCGSVPRSNLYIYPSYGINYFWADASTNNRPTCISGTVDTSSCTGLTANCTPDYLALTYFQSGNYFIATGINYHTVLRSQKSSLLYTYDSLTRFLERGNTPGLFSIIATGISPAIIQDSLLAAGPYLSDSVLKAAIMKTSIPMETLANILIPNTPLDASVVSTLSSIGLPDTLVARLNEYQSTSILSPRSVLIAGINYFQGMIDYTDNTFISAFETDTTIASPYDSAQAVLKADPVTLPRLAQLASLQWAAKENTTALVPLDTLKKYDVDSTYANYRKLLPVLMTLSSASSGYLSLKGNSTDSTLIAEIAMDTLTPGYANARAVMEYVYNKPFAEPILPLSGSHQPLKRNTSLLITTDATNSILAGNSLFKLYPNPAYNELNIQYSLGSNFTNANVELLDEVGNKVATWQLSSSQTIVTENIANLSPGFYLYNISVNNKTVQRGKLVIAR